MICPCCQEESFVQMHRGFNIVTCPLCGYFFVVYQDDQGRSWTREVGVLNPDGEGD